MNAPALASDEALVARARQSLGSSADAIYSAVERTFAKHVVTGETLVDVGCGAGNLWRFVGHRFLRYVGLDAVRYDGFPAAGEFCPIDLDDDRWPLVDGSADVVAAVEVIEHLENPWAFVRSLARLARPGAWVVVSTPNQLSGLSLLTLAVKSRFSAFQDVHFPTHRTALLEADLRRAAIEAGLEPVEVAYTLSGRVPLSPWHYPSALSRLAPRLLSDNLMMVARKSASHR